MEFLIIWLVAGFVSLIICVCIDGMKEVVTFENFAVGVVIVVFGPIVGILGLYIRYVGPQIR